MMSETYNSRTETLNHRKRVQDLVVDFVIKLIDRCRSHDESKLHSPEKELFDQFTPKLKDCTYGSEIYKGYLKELSVALDHHYKVNSHHPEHYNDGINGMDLLDIIEMFFDWKAAGERHADGNIFKSIEHNSKRFNLSDQLKYIFTNTANRLEGDFK